MKYTKDMLQNDVDWLMWLHECTAMGEDDAIDFCEADAIDFCLNLSHKTSNLVVCASNGCICEFGTDDLSNTTCNICGGEAK